MNTNQLADVAAGSVVITVLLGLFMLNPPFAMFWGATSIFFSFLK